jgi:site-specific recombinase XerD
VSGLGGTHVWRSFRKVVAAAGLTPGKWTPRELRHSFVSLLSDAGVRLSRSPASSGTAGPQPRRRSTGHIPRDWFRNQIWRPALTEAGVTVVRPHDLRHEHASWLLAGGADLQAVKERLGHASIATTEKYLHTLPDADDSTLDAFSRIRDRSAATRA